MRDGNNHDAIVVRAIDVTERKTPKKEAASAVIESRPRRWRALNL